METPEQIYDREIAPLMKQIIATCKAHKIPMLADFSLGDASDPGLKCTTMLLDAEWNPPAEMVEASRIISPRKRPVMMVTVTKADGSKEITAIT